MDEPGACGHEEDLLRGNDGEPHVGVTKLGPAATLDGRLGEADAGGADELGLVAVSVRYSVVLLNLFSLGQTTTRGRSRKSRTNSSGIQRLGERKGVEADVADEGAVGGPELGLLAGAHVVLPRWRPSLDLLLAEVPKRAIC
jgi:hypothetical protein